MANPQSRGATPVVTQRSAATVTTIAMLALALAGWAFLAWLVLDMSHPFARLTMPTSPAWDLANMLAILAMWSVMMAAMMLPSALPMVTTFVRLSRRSGEPARGTAFVAGYLAVWSGFSSAASAAQWLLQTTGVVNMMLVSTSASLTGALLLIAGVYQFSPLKRLCLSRCRSPLGFLLGEWRPGTSGAFAMGARHGLFCLGCCWAMMALLFVGGAMNLAWVAALAVGVAVEKLLPGGERLSMLLGVMLIAAGVYRLSHLFL